MTVSRTPPAIRPASDAECQVPASVNVTANCATLMATSIASLRLCFQSVITVNLLRGGTELPVSMLRQRVYRPACGADRTRLRPREQRMASDSGIISAFGQHRAAKGGDDRTRPGGGAVPVAAAQPRGPPRRGG